MNNNIYGMATSRPFAYNTGSYIIGTTQSGNIASGFPTNGFNSTGLQWWNGPDEDLGYVVAIEKPLNNQPTPDGKSASVAFWRSSALTDNSFITLAQSISKTQSFANANDAKTWLTNNGHWTSYLNSLWDGLVHYYTGDNTTQNYALSAYDGTLVNGATYAVGKINNGFSFDGVSTFMSTATASTINSISPHSYACWVKLSSNSSTRIFIGNGTSMLGFRSGGNLTFFQYYVNAEVNSNYTLSISTWYHITVTYKGNSFGSNNVLFYVNGSLVFTGTLGMPSGGGKIYLGSNNAGSGGFFSGVLDECVVWNRVLTASEVTQLYNSGSGKQYPN